MSPAVPVVAPSNVTGGGGTNGELIITWKVSVDVASVKMMLKICTPPDTVRGGTEESNS